MKKIAYFQIFGGPPIEKSVHDLLVTTFPEYEVRSIKIFPLLRKNPLTLALNFLATLKEFGLPLLLGKRSFKTSFLATTFIFSEVKKLALRELANNKSDYAFAFQLQSMFDASVPGIPHYVYIDHTHLANLEYPDFDPSKLNSTKWLELEKQIYTNASTIFTRSSNITRSLQNDYACPKEKIACVYVGVNTPDINTRPDNNHYSNKNILFVGTDWKRKGGPVLLKAFAIVLKTHPDATLTIVGCTPEINVPNCHAVGRIPVEETSKYYASASVFCLPTLHEPFGVVLIEAMQHQLPVVATRVGAIPDLVTDQTGIMVTPGDEDALSDALLSFLDNPDRANECGRNGFELVNERYNWRSVGTAIRQRITAFQD